jgi:hypothetical protein
MLIGTIEVIASHEPGRYHQQTMEYPPQLTFYHRRHYAVFLRSSF